MQKGRIGLLLAAAAAYGVYKYSKMTPQQKSELKNKGKDFLDKNFNGLRQKWNQKTQMANHN